MKIQNNDPMVAEQKRMDVEQTIQSIRVLTDLLLKEQSYRTGTTLNRLGLSEKEESPIKAKLITLVNKL